MEENGRKIGGYGLEIERKLFEDIFSEKERKGRGMPAAHPHKTLNSPLFILAAGGAVFRNGCQEVQPVAGSRHGILTEH